MKRSHHCHRCGRELTNPHSINRGYGPYCAIKIRNESSQDNHGTPNIKQHQNIGNLVKKELEKSVSPTVAVNIGINLLAASSPPVGTLLTMYNIAQQTDEIAAIADKALKKYHENNSVADATMSIVPDALELILNEVKCEAINTILPGTDPESKVLNCVLMSFI